jgi:hypothetical protein
MSSFRKKTAAEATRCCESLLGSVLQYVHVKKSSSPGRSQTTTCIHLPVQRRRRGTFHFGLAYEMRNVGDPRTGVKRISKPHHGIRFATAGWILTACAIRITLVSGIDGDVQRADGNHGRSQ